jgi:hypothetical protein
MSISALVTGNGVGPQTAGDVDLFRHRLQM